MSDLVRSEKDGVVTLTLNRPERRNALSRALGHELLGALRELAQDESARVLVLTGAGKAFCAGGDFSEIRAARFGLPFVNIGLAGADLGASYILPRLVGLTRATEMLLLGQTVTAEEAVGFGMIHRCVEPDALDQEVGDLVGRLARGPRLALRLTKI